MATSSSRSVKQEPIAIVGMAVNMPGSPSVDDLWNVLVSGRSTLEEISEDRFSSTQSGNFIHSAFEFDHKFFRISPREALSMDPQQRVLLHVAHSALQDSGYIPHSTPSFNPSTFGCFVGCATNDYIQNLQGNIDLYYSTGTLGAFLSGRMSYCLGLGGSSIVIDTACSSSFVAIHQACRALMNRDCDAALAGGVNIISSPEMFVGLERAHFLAPSNHQCTPFHATSDADGYARGEGCGLFVLKRLSDAVQENDRIYGVIRGVEINQSYLSSSITRPDPAAQERLFTRLLDGMSPDEVSLIEAHGTGTRVGDASEMEAIRRVFLNTGGRPLHVTSVKANIGHLEAASGSASLAKVLLMFRHGIVPRLISVQEEDREEGVLFARENVSWPRTRKDIPRMAMVNNFGASGSNAALLVEEYIPPPLAESSSSSSSSLVFGFSAKDTRALLALRTLYLSFLQKNSSARLSDIAYTMTARRQLYPCRMAISALTKEELVERLSSSDLSSTKVGESTASNGGVVFVFAGQGSQYRGMGRDFYASIASFKGDVDECDRIIRSFGFPGILGFITGNDEENDDAVEREEHQSAIFALQFALSRLFIRWGVKPSAVIGHSLGEYAALVTAGVLTLKDALLIVSMRAHLMFEKCALESTGMMAVSISNPAGSYSSEEQFPTPQTFLESILNVELSIACYNSPTDFVISGPLLHLADLKSFLEEKQENSIFVVKATQLRVPFAYHTPTIMNALADELASLGESITTHPACLPFVSTVLGCTIFPGDETFPPRDYFVRQCLDPVRFTQGVASYLSRESGSGSGSSGQGIIWLELGSHRAVLPMLRKCLPEFGITSQSSSSSSLFLSTLRKGEHNLSSLSNALAALYVTQCGSGINWRAVFEDGMSGGGVGVVSLPLYPFEMKKFFVPYVEDREKKGKRGAGANEMEINEHQSSSLAMGRGTNYSFIQDWTQFPHKNRDGKDDNALAIFQTPISRLTPYIEGHKVGGTPLCPASVYIELVFECVSLALDYLSRTRNGEDGGARCVVLREIGFPKPLTLSDSGDTAVVSVSMDTATRAFSVKSTNGVDHALGEYQVRPESEMRHKFASVLPYLLQRIEAVQNPRSNQAQVVETFSTRTVYEVIFPRVVEYSKEFHVLQYVRVSSDGMQATATMKPIPQSTTEKFYIHPFFIDALVHLAGFISNLHAGKDTAYICNEIRKIQVLPSALAENTHVSGSGLFYTLYCKVSSLPDQSGMLAESYAVLDGDADSRVLVARVKGMRFRRVRLGGLKSGLAKPLSLVSSPLSLFSPSVASQLGSPPVNTATKVSRIISKACEVPFEDIKLENNLEVYGIDSLMILELSYDLSKAFPALGCRPHELGRCDSIKDIVDLVSSIVDVDSAFQIGGVPPTPSSSSLFSSSSSYPRALVHTPDNGLGSQSPAVVKRVIARVLGMDEAQIDDDAELGYLGLDSLSSIEAVHALRADYQINVPGDLFEHSRTVRDVEGWISSLGKGFFQVSHMFHEAKEKKEKGQMFFTKGAGALSLLQNSESRSAPLVLIHDGSGLTGSYERMTQLGRKVWAISNPRFGTPDGWADVREMAGWYANLIYDEMEGPVVLGGWSFGGVVAYEVARQLQQKSVIVKGVVLIDAPSPLSPHVALPSSLIDHILDVRARTSSVLRKLCKVQFTTNARLLGNYTPGVVSQNKNEYPCLVCLISKEPYLEYPNRGDVPQWLSDRSDAAAVVRGWETLSCSPLKTFEIPGHHFEPFESQNVVAVSSRIAEACNIFDE